MIFKKNILEIADYLLILLIVISPYIFVVSMRLPIFSAIKELLQFCILLMLTINLMFSSKISKKYVSSLIVMCLLSFVLGGFNVTSFSLFFDGVRYQLGYILISLLYILNRHSINIDLVIKIIAINFVFVMAIGTYEYFNVSIINVLYGVDKESLSNVELAIGFRLISIFGNPINYSVFLCIGFSCFYYKYLQKRFYILPLITMLTAFNVAFTFSRAGLIVFAIIVLLIFYREMKNKILVVVPVLCVISVPLIFYSIQFIDTSTIVHRFSAVFSLDTYTQNARVINWANAISHNSLLQDIVGNGLGTSNPTKDEGGIVVENAFISIFIDSGFFGLLCYMSIFFVYFYKCSKNANGFIYMLFVVTFILFGMGNDIHRSFPYVLYFWVFFTGLNSNENINNRRLNC